MQRKGRVIAGTIAVIGAEVLGSALASELAGTGTHQVIVRPARLHP
jgi:hypothetical protein